MYTVLTPMDGELMAKEFVPMEWPLDVTDTSNDRASAIHLLMLGQPVKFVHDDKFIADIELIYAELRK